MIFGAFLNQFLNFFGLIVLYSAYTKSPTNFREARPNRYRDMVKWVGNMIILIFGVFLNRFLKFFFADRALFSLRKSPTKFREAGPSRYRDM